MAVRYPRFAADRTSGTFDLDRRITDCLTAYLERFQGMSRLSPRRRAASRNWCLTARRRSPRGRLAHHAAPRTVDYLSRHTRYGGGWRWAVVYAVGFFIAPSS
jgi:hypothetical protein